MGLSLFERISTGSVRRLKFVSKINASAHQHISTSANLQISTSTNPTLTFSVSALIVYFCRYGKNRKHRSRGFPPFARTNGRCERSTFPRALQRARCRWGLYRVCFF